MNWKDLEGSGVWPHVGTALGICLEGLMKIARNLNHDSSRCSSRGSNRAYPHNEVRNPWIYSFSPIRLHEKNKYIALPLFFSTR
jgi:hypothetical protein